MARLTDRQIKVFDEIAILLQSIKHAAPESKWDLLIYGLRRMVANPMSHSPEELVEQALRLTWYFDTLSGDAGSSNIDKWERTCAYWRKEMEAVDG